MGAAGAGAAAGASAAAAIAQAIKASGAIVSVEPSDFETIASRTDSPLVVVCEGRGLFSTKYQYLTGYKGLVFFTKSTMPLSLKPSVEIIEAKRIWIPG